MMLKAAALPLSSPDPLFDSLLSELVRLHQTLPLEEYLSLLDDFTDQARRSLAEIPDQDEQERMREQYRQVIEFALDLGVGNLQ